MKRLLIWLFFIAVLFSNCRPSVDRNFIDQFSLMEAMRNLLRPDTRFTFSYPQSSYSFTLGAPISSIFPISNKVVTSCSVSPALPAGISLGSACEILGTPIEIKAPLSYQISGFSEGLRSSFSVSIAVTSQAPTGFSYSGTPFTFTMGVNIAPLIPVVTGTITSCSASPGLPSGFVLDPDCRITGNPTATQSFTEYVITASNQFGSISTPIQITINANPPSGFSYPSGSYVFTEGIPITPIHPSITGSLTGCSASPSLPSGIIVTLPDCGLSGTPTGVNPSADYTITAINPYGSTSTTVNLTVNIAPPSGLSFAMAAYTFTQNQAITTITPSVSGTVSSCSILPALPPGLSIHGTTCAISGTPTTIQGATNYVVTATNSSGSTTANLSLTINTAPPSGLTYSPTAFTFTQGLAISTITPTVTGTITSCAITPALPSGLAIHATTCAISGTPTVLQSATTHTITASNISGSTTASINVTVNIAPPSGLSYSPSAYTFTQGLAISTITPSVTGTVTGCISSPALPVGLAIHPATCAISGTPTGTQAATDYIITASNSSGNSNDFTLSIAINIAPPSGLNYPSAGYTFTQNATISPLVASYTGTITSCSASPGLPAGLGISNTTCEITGTPSTVQGAATYTITASNGSGSSTFDLSLAVNIAPPSGLTYTPSAMTFTATLPISPITPTYTGTITNCVSAPALPTGLSLSTTNCEITGTPTLTQGATNYVITASNASGNTTANISITINIAPPTALNYAASPYTFTQGLAISPITPTYTGTVTNCTSLPALPTGLSLNATNCQITGTPTNIQASTAYAITASNASGSTSVTIHIAVNIAPPSGLNYTGSPYTFTQDLAISPITPSFSGTVTTCTSSTALPAGLTIHNTTCVISGVPFTVQGATDYLITASNSSGSSQFTVTISVNIAAPTALNYAASPYAFTQGLAISTITPTYTGTVTNCTSLPALPTGLSLNTTNCQITGTPANIQASTAYAITASNASGSTNFTIHITVNVAPPSGLNYPSSSYTFTEGAVISTLVATYSGTVTNCVASPPLPAGLGINATNCQITGTSTATQTPTVHTITASNGSGSSTFDLNITVNIAPPTALNYAGSPYTFTQNLAISTITPTYTGTVTSCSASPALPTGLGINNTNCAISGTPTGLVTNEVYTITASNSSGSVTFDITITVNVAAPTSLVYAGSPYTFTENVGIPMVIPTVAGTIETCSASPPLPAGLAINSTTCSISGTPTTVQGGTSYTITAGNVSGTVTASINIQVNLSPPTISYTGSPFAFTRDMAISPLNPTLVGTVTNCTSSPPLPTGLSINNTTCVISGTPTILQGATDYTITASNGSGGNTANITISVVANPPANLVYPGNPLTLLRTIPITIVPTVDGTVSSCSVTPSLPAGLSLNTTNCTLSGTPTTNQAPANYTVTATNSFGSTPAIISIQVIHPGRLYSALFGSTTTRASRYGNARTLVNSSFLDMGTIGVNYAIGLDVSRDVMYVGSASNSIFVFANASTNTGTHNRLIAGTIMRIPGGFAVDEANDRLYFVSNNSTEASKRDIYRVNNASTTDTGGAVAPSVNFRRILAGAILDAGTEGIRRIALVGTTLYVNDFGNSRVVAFHDIAGYNNGATATANRIIDLGYRPAGIAVDTANDLMFISSFDENMVKVYSGANTLSGGATPIRTLEGTSFSGPCGLRFIPSLNRLYVSNFFAETIITIENANTINGIITPSATLTGIPGISDVAVDITR